MEKDPAIYVRHILQAIANIEADIAGYDFDRFRVDRRTRQLVERNLEILSEASRRIPNEHKDREAMLIAATPAVITKTESLSPREFPASVADPILKGLLASMRRLAA